MTTNDTGEFKHANEEWRHDPKRKQEWADHLARETDAVRKAQQHLAAARDAMRRGPYPVGGYGHEAIYRRVWEAVHQADYIMSRDAEYITEEPSDILLGNLAAFGRPGGQH